MTAPPASKQPHHATNEWALERHVYEPHVVGLPPVGQYLQEIWRRREFAFELARTKLREQQFQTVFGMLWLVLNPILLALVYFILIDIVRAGAREPAFFAHLTACIFAYYLISQAMRDGAMAVVRGGKLILNSAFPRMLLPLSSTILAIKRFIPTVLIYVPIHIASDLPFGAHLLWVIPLLFLMVCMAAGFAMLAAAVQVYFRDLKAFLPYALRIMLYAAPVLYFAERVPDRYQILVDINPLGRLFSAWDNVIHFGVGPGVHNMVIATIWSVGALIVGAVVFMSREREFAVRI